ncbi:hypothetical protein HMI54_010120 [Coelomomyces lativittatus]|nr:hypothetical protein HMI54_010120 [Coelomomyces lativittatus]
MGEYQNAYPKPLIASNPQSPASPRRDTKPTPIQIPSQQPRVTASNIPILRNSNDSVGNNNNNNTVAPPLPPDDYSSDEDDHSNHKNNNNNNKNQNNRQHSPQLGSPGFSSPSLTFGSPSLGSLVIDRDNYNKLLESLRMFDTSSTNSFNFSNTLRNSNNNNNNNNSQSSSLTNSSGGAEDEVGLRQLASDLAAEYYGGEETSTYLDGIPTTPSFMNDNDSNSMYIPTPAFPSNFTIASLTK